MLVALLALAGCADCPQVEATDTSGDLARCEQLYAEYWRYRNTGGQSNQGASFQGALAADAALENCRRGNTREGIAALRRQVGSGGCR